MSRNSWGDGGTTRTAGDGSGGQWEEGTDDKKGGSAGGQGGGAPAGDLAGDSAGDPARIRVAAEGEQEEKRRLLLAAQRPSSRRDPSCADGPRRGLRAILRVLGLMRGLRLSPVAATASGAARAAGYGGERCVPDVHTCDGRRCYCSRCLRPSRTRSAAPFNGSCRGGPRGEVKVGASDEEDTSLDGEASNWLWGRLRLGRADGCSTRRCRAAAADSLADAALGTPKGAPSGV